MQGTPYKTLRYHHQKVTQSQNWLSTEPKQNCSGSKNSGTSNKPFNFSQDFLGNTGWYLYSNDCPYTTGPLSPSSHTVSFCLNHPLHRLVVRACHTWSRKRYRNLFWSYSIIHRRVTGWKVQACSPFLAEGRAGFISRVEAFAAACWAAKATRQGTPETIRKELTTKNKGGFFKDKLIGWCHWRVACTQSVCRLTLVCSPRWYPGGRSRYILYHPSCCRSSVWSWCAVGVRSKPTALSCLIRAVHNLEKTQRIND